MSNIDNALPFINTLLKREHEAQRARAAEPDSSFVPKLQAVNELFSHEMSVQSGITRGAMTDADLQRGRAQLGSITQRRLYEISEYKDGRFGRLFGAKLGGAFDFMPAPELVWYVAETNEGWRVVASASACFDCGGTGAVDSNRCIACKGRGWEPSDGADISRLAPPVETRRLA